MAQTGYTPISIYYSSTAAATPTAGNLVAGELAINTADGKLFYKDSAGVVQVIGTKGGVGSSSNTQVLYNSSGSVVGSANFTYASGQIFVQQSIAGNAQNLALENGSTTGTVTSSLAFTSSGVAKASITSAVYGNGYMAFATNDNTEKMRIDASGNVGIGTTSPVNKLAVVGGNAGNMRLDNAGEQYTQFLMQRNSTANTGGDILIDGTNSIMYIRSLFAGRISIGTSASAGSPVERLSVNTTGTISLQGASTATTGVGITFPATQSASSDANTLDDYEEGTWTPTAYGQGSAGVTVTSIASGNYTKVGNQVTVTLYIAITSMTGTGTLLIGGFPFTNNNGYGWTTGSLMASTVPFPTSTTSIVLYMGPNRNYCEIYASGNNVGWSTIQTDSVCEFIGTITYLV